MYLIIECTELNDQWECDCDRKPLRIVGDYTDYIKYGYEIYEIETNNELKLIKEYYVGD